MSWTQTSHTAMHTIAIYSPQTVRLTEYYGESVTRLYTYYTVWHITIYSHYNIVTTYVSRYVSAITTYHVDPAGKVFSISISTSTYLRTVYSRQETRFVSTRTDTSYAVHTVPADGGGPPPALRPGSPLPPLIEY